MPKPKQLFIRSFPLPLAAFELDKPELQNLIACPNPPIEALQAGRAIAVPTGEFDAGIILEQLPRDFQPEIVELSIRDPSFLPVGLEKFSCPKVMKLGDTFHWGDGSLSNMVHYCQVLQCDYHWVYQGVQHLHFFVEAGLKNVFWLPGTAYIDHYVPAKSEQKIYDIIFRGSESGLHIHRSRLLRFLEQSKVSIDVQSKPYLECLEDYTKSHIVFNCSLNGDLNRRVFEVLMAGGFLLTDRLSPQSGLFQLFEEGKHLECYGSEAELLEKVNFYLQHPEKAAQIAAAGQQKLLSCYSQTTTQKMLYHYVLTGQLESPFNLEHDCRIQKDNLFRNHQALNVCLKVYELIQELQRLNARIKLLYWRGIHKELVSDLADLPRVDFTYANSAPAMADTATWCIRAGVHEQVDLKPLPLDTEVDQTFEIVIVDLPTLLETQHLWELKSLVAKSGFLIIVGTDLKLTRLLKSQIRTLGFQPITLSVETTKGSRDKLGFGACLIYQKSAASPDDLSTSTSLTFNTISRQTQVREQLKSFPLVHQVHRFVRQALSH
ncbi:glycosyltransferase [Phormidesmis sp. 146-35]